MSTLGFKLASLAFAGLTTTMSQCSGGAAIDSPAPAEVTTTTVAPATSAAPTTAPQPTTTTTAAYAEQPTATTAPSGNTSTGGTTLVASPLVASVLPANGALFGAHANVRNGADFYTSLTNFEAQVGRRMAIANRYHNWSDKYFGNEQKMIAGGRLPLISWRPTDGVPDANRASKIAAGNFDSTIVTAAQGIKALGSPVLLRWDWEMDQSPGEPEYIGTPAEFIAAWRHIRSVFSSQGVTNVMWVWAPRAAAFPKGVAQQFYPGDSEVDWIGASAVPPNSWRSFDEIFSGFYAWGTTRQKPLLVWSGESENPNDSNWKANWFTQTATALHLRYPAVRAFVYYHALSPEPVAYWADTTPQAFTAFRHMACESWFNPEPGATCNR